MSCMVAEMLQEEFLCDILWQNIFSSNHNKFIFIKICLHDIKTYFYSIKINSYSIKSIYMISKYIFI